MREPEGWVLYDGSCGVCSTWLPAWAPRLARIGLGVRPLQDPWVATHVPIDEATLLAEVHLVFADGRYVAGADVYREILRRRWWTMPASVLSRMPLLRQLFDAGYRGFARHRHGISRTLGLQAPTGDSCDVGPGPP